MEKIKVGVLGATGMVGQYYISLLENHPWFEISYVAASPKSAGKKYHEAVSGRWHIENNIPFAVKDLIVEDANNLESVTNRCSFVFSALEMEKQAIKELEKEYAKIMPVVSNASAHRDTEDVPMLIPEINPHHLDILPAQQKKNGWRGFIVVKPNCSLQSYMTPLYALINKGYKVKKVVVKTMQAVSGAGYPGVASLDIIDNIIPYIKGEDEKSENEPLKILGEIKEDKFINYQSLKISAHCTRVPVNHGYIACVSLEFGSKKPELEEILRIWKEFRALPQELQLPFAPQRPILYREEVDRPQPKIDRDVEKGMAVVVGRLEKCNALDIKFIGLSHNMIRGAAGGGILNAELLKAKGYLG